MAYLGLHRRHIGYGEEKDTPRFVDAQAAFGFGYRICTLDIDYESSHAYHEVTEITFNPRAQPSTKMYMLLRL